MEAERRKRLRLIKFSTLAVTGAMTIFLVIASLIARNAHMRIVELIGAGLCLALTILLAWLYKRMGKKLAQTESEPQAAELDEYLLRRNLTSYIGAFWVMIWLLWMSEFICPPLSRTGMSNLAMWLGLATFSATGIVRGAFIQLKKGSRARKNMFIFLSAVAILSAVMVAVSVSVLIMSKNADFSSTAVFISTLIISSAGLYRLKLERDSAVQEKMSKLAQKAGKDMTVSELADKVKVSWITIDAIETGKYIPSVKLGLAISQALEVPIAELFD